MMRKNILLILTLVFSAVMFAQGDENSEGDGPDLANQIQNPIASLISVPFQNNLDFNTGPYDRSRNTLNIQPVIPLSLSEGLNLVTRTIIPIISQPVGMNVSKSGLGDLNLSLFLTPTKPSKVIYGGGVALGLPTASNEVLGSEKWSAGPSIIALIQPEGWTIGALAQNTWSYAGADNRGDINFFFSQVFVTKNLSKGWYVNSSPIITANWEAPSGEQWTVPLGGGFGKLFKLGNLPINAQVGYYNNVVAPNSGPDSQFRFQVVLLFPK